jgi:hypothetical protein
MPLAVRHFQEVAAEGSFGAGELNRYRICIENSKLSRDPALRGMRCADSVPDRSEKRSENA